MSSRDPALSVRDNKDADDHMFAQELQKFCNGALEARKDGKEIPEPLSSERLWRYVLKLATISPGALLPFNWNAFCLYREFVPEFSTSLPKFIQEMINKITEESTGYEKILPPMIRVLPFFETADALRIIDAGVDIVDSHIRRTRELPIDFLRIFGDVMTEDFSRETFKLVVEYFESGLDGDDPERYLAICAVFSELCADIATYKSEAIENVNETITKLIKSGYRDKTLVGLYMLARFSVFYQKDPEACPSPQSILDIILPKLVDDEMSIALMAHKAVRSLFKAELFQTDASFKSFTEIYEKYPENKLRYFFRILDKIVAMAAPRPEIAKGQAKEAAKIDLTVFISFAGEQLSKETTSPEAKGQWVNFIYNMICMNKEAVGKYWVKAWRACLSILKHKNTEEYARISPFLCTICKYHPKKIPVIGKYLTRMIEELPKETMNISTRLNLGIDIVDMIAHGALEKVPVIIPAIAIKAMDTKSQVDLLKACTILTEAAPVLSEKSAAMAFEKVSAKALEEKEAGVLDLFLKTLRKLIKHFDLKTPAVQKFTDDIVLVRLKHFPGKTAACFREGARYLNTYIRRYPHHVPMVLRIYSSFVEQVHPQDIPKFISVFKTAILDCYVDDKGLKEIWSIATRYFTRCELPHFFGVLASLDTMIAAWNKNYKVCNPVLPIINHCMLWINEADTTQQHTPAQNPILEMIPTMAVLIFGFAAFAEEEVKSSIDTIIPILKRLLKFLPFPPEVVHQKKIIDHLMKMLMQQQYAKLHCRICVVLLELLVLNEEDYSEFKFDDVQTKKMKFMMKMILGNDLEKRKKVTKKMINASRDKEALDLIFQ